MRFATVRLLRFSLAVFPIRFSLDFRIGSPMHAAALVFEVGDISLSRWIVRNASFFLTELRISHCRVFYLHIANPLTAEFA